MYSTGNQKAIQFEFVSNDTRSKDATATRTSFEKWINVLSGLKNDSPTYFVKSGRTFLKSNSKGPYPSSEREITFRYCLFTFSTKREMRHVSHRSNAKAAKKRERRDARAKLLFCLLNLLFVCLFVCLFFFYVLVAVALLPILTRDDSKRRFQAQHIVAMLKQCCNHSKQCRNSVVMLCCTKNRHWQSSRVTSP